MLALSTGVWIATASIVVIVLVAAWFTYRATYNEHLPALRPVPLFHGLSDKELRKVARLARPVSFEPGAKILAEGDDATALFVVHRGRAKVISDGTERSTIEPDEPFGELSLLDGGPRTATVVAETPVTVLEIPSGTFLTLLDGDAVLRRRIYVELARRLQHEGGPRYPDAPAGAVGRDELADIAGRLRATRSA